MKRNIVREVQNVNEVFEYCMYCLYYDECDLSAEDFEEAGLDGCPYFEPAEEDKAC